MDGLSPDEVGERIADRQWLAVEDHVAFQDWVVDTLRDPLRTLERTEQIRHDVQAALDDMVASRRGVF